uniref:Uncharacterized protein n=1 Tax=Oryza rufipogon TaxID=4529 RepID=A0A0E0QN40_ORYRU
MRRRRLGASPRCPGVPRPAPPPSTPRTATPPGAPHEDKYAPTMERERGRGREPERGVERRRL